MNQAVYALAGAACVVISAPAAHAGDDRAPVTPYADLRYRLELVDQDGLPRDATASTLRVRAGLKSAQWKGLSAVVEGEAIIAIGAHDYNDTTNGKTRYPVVADPTDAVLNQAYVRWQPIAAVGLTGGRQTINLDNQRWVGSVNWRQNDQTFDAARIALAPVAGASIDYFHAWRVNRVFGPDSPQGTWHDTRIDGARAGYAIRNIGTLSAYGYWLDIPFSPSSSSKTVGVRMAGEHAVAKGARVHYAAEFARQHDHANNPRSFALDYMLIEPGASYGPVTIKAGLERLEGNGQSAVQTPLATLHAFNGWADKFLTTPAAGLRDVYLDASYKSAASGPLRGLQLRAAWHDYRSTHGDIAYGHEWNALASIAVKPAITATLKAAYYDARGFATDTAKAWFQIEAKF